MKPRALAYLFGGIVIAAAIAWIGWERHVMALTAAEIVTSRAEVARLRDATQTLDVRTTRLENDLATARRQLAAAQQPPSVAAPQHPRMPSREPAERDRQWAVRRRAMVALQLLPAIQALRLSDEQAKKLTDICVERMAQGSDVYSAASDQHLGPESEGLRAMLKQTEDEWRAKVVALLGEDGWRVVQDYQRPMGGMAVQGIAADLCFSPEPLSAAQSDALRHAIGEMPEGEMAFSVLQPFRYAGVPMQSSFPLEKLDSALAATERFRAAVLPLLTPTQREIVENRLAVAELDLRLTANSYAIWRSVRKSGEASSGPPH
jgi:hypothetical protein